MKIGLFIPCYIVQIMWNGISALLSSVPFHKR